MTSRAKQVKEVQKKIEVLMTNKEIKFEGGSWDINKMPENKAVMEDLATILKENPHMSINVHGVQIGVTEHSQSGEPFKDGVTKKTFAECFPNDPDPFAEKRTDALARTRAVASVHALKNMGCKNVMTVSSENGEERKIVFSVNK